MTRYAPGQPIEAQTAPGAWQPATYRALRLGQHLVEIPEVGIVPAHEDKIRAVPA